MSIQIFGIKNCSTMKKAMNWLSLNGVEYDLHDYKKEGVNEAWLKAWCKLASWDSLLNTRGTTWRKLNDGERVNVDEKKACELMKQYPSLVKRPVLVDDSGQVHIGFSEAQYQQMKFARKN
ncbi:MAG TPA: ArsC family reductase [Betaproteobacteria bacterium]|jgi:arsenate reductase (glutaredoxin)|nr:ArsC family reductase [Betaproteobacteria bacterium]